MIIMPSTPRLSTPDRSTTSSPAAASSSGVEAASTARMIGSMSPIGGLPGRNESDAIENERVAGEHVEQQDALEHAGQIERELHGDLRLFAADEGERQEQAGDENADRVQPAEERDDNRRETVTRRDVGLQMANRPGNFNDPRQTRERAGNRERQHHELIGIEAGETRGARRRTDNANLETLDRAPDDDPRDGHNDQREQRTD